MKSMKTIGIVASVIIMLLGICMFIRPLATGGAMIWILVAGVLVRGIEEIVSYFKMPKGERDGFLLASGIITTLISVLLILRGFNMSFMVTASLEACVATMLGITCMFSGIGRIISSGVIKKMGGSRTLAILGGVMELICGVAVLGAPIMSLYAITVAFGIYLFIMGAALLFRSLSIKVDNAEAAE